jgi:hypothetical protein
MLKDKLEVLDSPQPSRRRLLKGLLIGLGAGLLVQAAGGVSAQAQQDQPKAEKGKAEKKKMEKAKGGDKKESKKGGEKKKTEEPKAQHKK